MRRTYEVQYIDELGRLVGETFDSEEKAMERYRILLEAGVNAEVCGDE